MLRCVVFDGEYVTWNCAVLLTSFTVDGPRMPSPVMSMSTLSMTVLLGFA